MCADSAVVIGLDVGGTSVKAGLVAADGGLVGRDDGLVHFPMASDQGREAVLAQFDRVLRALWALAGGRPVVGIGVGMPGPFDYTAGVSLIRGLRKYDSICGVNLKDDWRRRLGLDVEFPIRFINDAAAFALGESRYGVARGKRRVMAVTLGTGCGGAFVVDGRIVTEGEGVPRRGEVYHLPFRGSILDEWVSRRGILRLWQEIDPGRANWDVKELADAARSGDPAALRLWEEWAAVLADALGPVAEAFRPDLLVLGGRIARSADLFAGPLAARLGGRVAVAADPAAGVRGAASLVWDAAGAADARRRGCPPTAMHGGLMDGRPQDPTSPG
ncbi:MAG: ROK family protein [Symbiobacterium sp.]|uniref:ROK family protein n=1 Tax=Symbiobacterium sp. TaxID=1971213 RepID=UPI0034648588